MRWSNRKSMNDVVSIQALYDEELEALHEMIQQKVNE